MSENLYAPQRRPIHYISHDVKDDKKKPEQVKKEEKEPSSFRKSLSSMLTPPAKKNYNKVLAASYEKSTTASTADDSSVKNLLTDEEKAQRLVAQRDANSVTGTFLLGVYKPLSVSAGYEDYYTAKGMVGK